MKNIIITLLAALTYGCSLTEPLSDAKTHTQKEVVHIQKPQPPRVIQIRQEHPQHQGMVIHDGVLHRIGTHKAQNIKEKACNAQAFYKYKSGSIIAYDTNYPNGTTAQMLSEYINSTQSNVLIYAYVNTINEQLNNERVKRLARQLQTPLDRVHIIYNAPHVCAAKTIPLNPMFILKII